jgi:hypothetical protein
MQMLSSASCFLEQPGLNQKRPTFIIALIIFVNKGSNVGMGASMYFQALRFLKNRLI